MSVNFKIPDVNKLVSCQFFQVPVSCGLLAGYQWDPTTKTLYAKESQVIIPPNHGYTHVVNDPVPLATCDSNGLMSLDDKCKLDSMLQTRLGILGYQGAGFPDDGGWMCFPEGSQVTCPNSTTKSIQDLKFNDEVITHKGSIRKVLKLFKRQYNGELIKIWMSGHHNNKLKMTPEHPLLAIKNKFKHSSIKVAYSGINDKPSWIPACELSEGDYIARRFASSKEIDRNEICINELAEQIMVKEGYAYSYEYAKDSLSKGKEHTSWPNTFCNDAKPILNSIGISPEFLRLCGYYLSEGHIDGSTNKPKEIIFSIHTEEAFGSIGADISYCCEFIFGIKPKIKQSPSGGNCHQLCLNSSIAARFIKKLLPGTAHTKVIPQWMMELPPEKQKHLLGAFFQGDGSINIRKKSKTINCGLCNEQLINQLCALLERQGATPILSSGRTFLTTTKKWYDKFIVTIQSSDLPWLWYELGGPELIANNEKWPLRLNFSIKSDNYTLRRINTIEKEQYNGNVYNIAVDEDNSYIINGAIVHNCGDIILAAGSEFISIERIGNTVRFTVDSPVPLNCSCFISGSQVLMSDGTTKNIEDIKVNDLVITHNGSISKVSKTLVREYNGEVLDFDIVGHKSSSFVVTPEHPLYAYNEVISKRRKQALKSVGYINTVEEEWIKAGQLKQGDYLERRFSHTFKKDVEIIDITNFSNRKWLEKDGKVFPSRDMFGLEGIDGIAYGIPKNIEVDQDLMRLFGYYLAEGCISEKNGLRFTVHIDELLNADIGAEIIRIMRDKFGLEGKIYKRSNTKKAVDICYRSKILCDLLEACCGKYSKTKKISQWIMDLPSEKQLYILSAFIEGDGYFRKRHSEFSIEISNEQLINQLAFIADRSNIPVKKPKPRHNGGFKNSVVYRMFISSSHAPELTKEILGINQKDAHTHNFIKTSEGVLTKIKGIQKKHHSGFVYNLEVEGEHTYIVNGIAVHNCEACAQIFWIQDESEVNAIRPPSCNGKMPGVNAYGELKIYTLPENIIVDSRNPLDTLNKKANYPALIFSRYSSGLTPYENEIAAILKRNSNKTTNVGWHMTPGTKGVVNNIWYMGNASDGSAIKFEMWPESTPGMLGQLLYNGNLITKQPAVIIDYTSGVLNDNIYVLKKWNMKTAAVIGSSFNARNVWRYDNPENGTTGTDPKTLVLDKTVDLLPIGTLVDVYQFETSRTSTARNVVSYFIKEPNANPAQLWALAAATRFGDLLTAREEINNPISNTALTASESDVADIRLFENDELGLTNFEDRLLLSNDGKASIDSSGHIEYQPSGTTINNDIVADVDYSIPGMHVLEQDKTAVGDLNGDGIIDTSDLQIFACAYGSKVGDPNYRTDCDFNEDGFIDVRDLAIIAQNFDLSVEKVVNRPVFLWHRQNHTNVYLKGQIGMPEEAAQIYPPYDILLTAPVDKYDDSYFKVTKRGVFTVGPFAGAPYIVVKGLRWKDLPAQGVMRVLTGAFRNVIWRYYFKLDFADQDDNSLVLVGRDIIFPFDEDFPIYNFATDCTYSPTSISDITGTSSADVDTPTNTTVIELLHQDYTAPTVRLQFDTNYSSGLEAVQLQIIVGILDMSVPYPLATGADPADDYVRGFAPGYIVSKVMIQTGFILDGIGATTKSSPEAFKVYKGGELAVPVDGQTEKWNNLEIMYKDGQCWVWWNDLLVSPDTTLSAALPTPVAVNTPYFPLQTLMTHGKTALRLFPGSVIRSLELRNQVINYNEYTKGQLSITS